DARARCLGRDAHRPGAVDRRLRAGLHRDLAGLRELAQGGRGMKRAILWASVAVSALLAACSGEAEAPQYGQSPKLPQPERGILPDMVIAEPAPWGDQRPTVPEGYTITAI